MDLDDAVRKIVELYEPEQIYVKGCGRPLEEEVQILIIKRTIKNRIERMWDVYRIVEKKCFPARIIVLTPEELNERVRLGDPVIKAILSGRQHFR